MKRFFFSLLLTAALCLLGACGAGESAAPQSIADAVPYLQEATVTFPYKWVGEHPVALPTSDAQAAQLRELLGAISLQGFEACEPRSVGGGTSIVMDLADTGDPAQACRLQILWAGDPRRGDNHAAVLYPEDTYYVAFQLQDGSEQAYLGQSAELPFAQLTQFLDDLVNDREDTANIGRSWLLAAPEEPWVLSKADAATVQVIFDTAVGADGADCPGGYDGAVEIRGVTYQLQLATGCFSREEGGATAVGRLEESDGRLADVLFRCHFPTP